MTLLGAPQEVSKRRAQAFPLGTLLALPLCKAKQEIDIKYLYAVLQGRQHERQGEESEVSCFFVGTGLPDGPFVRCFSLLADRLGVSPRSARHKSALRIYSVPRSLHLWSGWGGGPAACGSRFRPRRNPFGTVHALPHTGLGVVVPATLLFLP